MHDQCSLCFEKQVREVAGPLKVNLVTSVVVNWETLVIVSAQTLYHVVVAVGTPSDPPLGQTFHLFSNMFSPFYYLRFVVELPSESLSLLYFILI